MDESTVVGYSRTTGVSTITKASGLRIELPDLWTSFLSPPNFTVPVTDYAEVRVVFRGEDYRFTFAEFLTRLDIPRPEPV